eukprot:m51a1_g12785 putative serine threonine protein kinase braf (486) ;mRNA; r:675-4129
MRLYSHTHGYPSHETSRALELYGWPLTRARLLDTIFRDIRTFKLYDYTLGPYGDGVGREGARQTDEDWCNQGAHEVFMTAFDLTVLPDIASAVVEVPSFRFSGCTARWNDTSRKALIGFKDRPAIVRNPTLAGLFASAHAHNSENTRPVALIEVVNLFASYYQEVRTAASFLIHHEKARKITLVWNSETHKELLGWNVSGPVTFEYMSYENATFEELNSTVDPVGSSYIVVAPDQEAQFLMELIGPDSPIVFASVVTLFDQYWSTMGDMWNHLFHTSRTPALQHLSSRCALRKNLESWVSAMDMSQESFESFIAGRFISAVISDMDEDGAKDEITADKLLDTIYSKKFFKIDNTPTVGPFLDQSSSGDDRVCNKGMDTIYHRGKLKPKKIKRSELEIGERIGKGQFGTVHNGDWHGTPVAIRVIDKTAITREDLKAVKSEMALTHSLQHPNLMMVLGYSGKLMMMKERLMTLNLLRFRTSQMVLA